MDISVVLAKYNARKTAFENVHTLHNYLAMRFSKFEIIVVDDGSREEEKFDPRELPKTVKYFVQQENQGKGAAIKIGMELAKGDCIIFTDADLPYDLSAIDYVHEKITDGTYHFIAGDRNHAFSNTQDKIKFHRKILTFCYNTFAHLMTGGVRDTQCGFKAFSKDLAKRVFPQLTVNRFAFDVEIFHLIHVGKVPFLQIPVVLRNNEVSTVRVLRDSLQMLFDLMRIFSNYLSNLYDYLDLTKLVSEKYWIKTSSKNTSARKKRS